MNRRFLRLLAPLPLVALLASCSAAARDGALTSDDPTLPTTIAQPQESATDLQTDSAPGAVAAKDRSFGVVPPERWVDETAKQRKTIVFLKDPKPVDKIFRTFSVIRTSLKKPMPLGELVEQGMIGQRQKGATVTKMADRRIGGVPAGGYRMTREAKDDKGAVKVVQSQYYVVRGETVYITTTTSAASDRSPATDAQDAILSSWSWGAPDPSSSSSGSDSSGGSATTPPPSGQTGSSTSSPATTPSTPADD